MKKRAFIIFLVVTLLVTMGVVLERSPVGGLIRWKIDALLGYRLAFPAEQIGDYEVTLIQEPGNDFYSTYFLIRSKKEGETRLVIDGDDFRWRHPKQKTDGDRVYYLRDSDAVTERTSYIDRKEGKLYAGYLQRALLLSQLDPDRQYQ